jgi:hypothetical protein
MHPVSSESNTPIVDDAMISESRIGKYVYMALPNLCPCRKSNPR